MALSVGFVGLPNVGKSTLFNAITKASVQAENFPFCTIEPNTGIVPLNDVRLPKCAEICKSQKIVPATITFTDIAGLVKGASKGEGLGNAFLTNIRQTSAIAQVVRCFEDENVIHVNGKIDPLDDIAVINTELILSDYEHVGRILERLTKKSGKAPDKETIAQVELLKKLQEGLGQDKPVRTLLETKEEEKLVEGFQFLSAKKVIYIANVSEEEISAGSPSAEKVKEYALSQGDSFAMISAQIEAELVALEEEERKEYMETLGLDKPGLDVIAEKCFDILGLQTFLTAGPLESRAWTIRKNTKAPQAAGVIHTDFESGFIRANIVSYDDFVACGSFSNARDKGLLRQEGKEYIMQDGDVTEFLFNN